MDDKKHPYFNVCVKEKDRPGQPKSPWQIVGAAWSAANGAISIRFNSFIDGNAMIRNGGSVMLFPRTKRAFGSAADRLGDEDIPF
jgi:hypothetical protein